MVKATLFIEAQANIPGAASRSLEDLIVEMKESKVNITGQDVSEEEEDGEETKTYSSFAEVDVDMPLREFLRLCMRVTPSTLEVTDAEKELTAKEAMYLIGDMCKVIGTCCQSAGVRLPMPKTQFGDETQKEPGIDEDAYDEFIDEGYIHYKFVTKVAGDEELIKRDTLRVLNVLGAYVNTMKLKEEGDQSNGFMGLAAIDILIPDVETLFEIALRFSPIAMTLEHPSVLSISLLDIQNLAINVSSLVTDITNYITIKKHDLAPKEN